MTPPKKSAAGKKPPRKPAKPAAAKPAAAKPKLAKKPTEAAKKSPKKAAAPAKGAAAKQAPGKKKAKDEALPPARPGPLVVARGKLVSKLGVRWSCWACGSVFYDLNKPKPHCPKCGADPRNRPESERSEEPVRKRDTIRALRVLDDEEVAAVPDDDTGEELDLDLELGADEKLLDEAEEPEPDEE
jgi:hypothetical protein